MNPCFVFVSGSFSLGRLLVREELKSLGALSHNFTMSSYGVSMSAYGSMPLAGFPPMSDTVRK